MKKYIIFIAAIFITIPLLASPDENTPYVKANGKVLFGVKVKIGIANYTITTNTGEKIKIPCRDIEGYMTNKERYDQMPVDLSSNSEKIMMKFISFRNGLSLYFLQCPKNPDPKLCDCFRVYKDGKLYLKMNEQNGHTVLPFFGLRCPE
jgi:hypothetical protein